MASNGFEDDDFGDFGGFEAAEPVAAVEAQSIPPTLQSVASPSPWAMLPGASVPPIVNTTGAEDDLTADVSTVSAPAAQVPAPAVKSLPNIDDHSGGTNWAELGEEMTQKEAGCHGDNQKTGDINVFDKFADFEKELTLLEKQPSSLPTVPSGGEKDASDRSVKSNQGSESGISLDFDLDLGFGSPATIAKVTEVSSSAASSESLLSSEKKDNIWADISGKDNFLPSAAASDAVSKDKFLEIQDQLSNSEKERKKLDEELKEILQSKSDLESCMEDYQHKLKEQKEKYDTLQEKHSSDLEGMREAGHDTLAIMVEEYKELCKVTVLQQQEECQKQLVEVLQKNRHQYEEQLKKQETSLCSQLEEMKSEAERQLKNAFEDQQKQFQKQLESSLAEERERGQEGIQKALQEQKELQQSAIADAIKKEQEKTKTLLEEEQKKMTKMLQEEKERGLEMTQTTLNEEREKCRKCLEEAVKEERRRGEDRMKKAMGEARDQAKEYLHENRQADARVRQRSLASIDLLLEGAKKQLEVLLSQPEKPPDGSPE